MYIQCTLSDSSTYITAARTEIRKNIRHSGDCEMAKTVTGAAKTQLNILHRTDALKSVYFRLISAVCITYVFVCLFMQ